MTRSSFVALFNRAATEQGGLLDGKDPTAVNLADPLRLWIIQVGIIIGTAQLLSLLLRKLRQPRVIAEVLGGILLGPTAFGRIPGFTDHIFPKDSIPFLSLVANIGLVLFLFLVGLEIETTAIKKNARNSLPIALGGMILPFGLGAALAVPLYHKFIDQSTQFTHFMLFTGVAYSITAFPVLCRILTELKLVDTTVGIVVLSAGVGNDIVGWTLLALSVALVNASSGLMALWILLTALAWSLFCLFPARYFFRWLSHRTGSMQSGPSMFFMTVTIIFTFASAFFTDVIGVHAIFGGFLAGLVVPREGNLSITLTEKLEDMVSIIFLPLYFTISGLSTDLGLLNTGETWAFTVAICVLAYSGKFGGCTVAARSVGFNWREASTIGTLMSCKGLVELIVLNVGLSAGILTPRVFAMFVLEALLLTFMTTPVVSILYPPRYRVRISALGEHANIYDNNIISNGEKGAGKLKEAISGEPQTDENLKTSFTVVLDKLDHLPGMLAFTQLIQLPPVTDRDADLERDNFPLEKTVSKASSAAERRQFMTQSPRSRVVVDALRLIELSDRTSAVMKSTSDANELVQRDPLLAVYKTFGELNDLPIRSYLNIVPFEELANAIAEHVYSQKSHLVMLPWLPPSIALSANRDHNEQHDAPPPVTASSSLFYNPFEALFKSGGIDRNVSLVHSHFVREVFKGCPTDVALYIDRDDQQKTHAQMHQPKRRGGKQHIFMPFFGGPDDRLALEFVVQLCANPKITATVLRITKADGQLESELIGRPTPVHTVGHDERTNVPVTALSMSGQPDTVYGLFNTEVALQSETADNLAWYRYSMGPNISSDAHPQRVVGALERVEFTTLSTPAPLHTVLDQARLHSAGADGGYGVPDRALTIVLGRSRRLAVENHQKELKEIVEAQGGVSNEVRKTVGDVATALMVAGERNMSIVVMQSANCSTERE